MKRRLYQHRLLLSLFFLLAFLCLSRKVIAQDSFQGEIDRLDACFEKSRFDELQFRKK